jgi:hypothetical protein
MNVTAAVHKRLRVPKTHIGSTSSMNEWNLLARDNQSFLDPGQISALHRCILVADNRSHHRRQGERARRGRP